MFHLKKDLKWYYKSYHKKTQDDLKKVLKQAKN